MPQQGTYRTHPRQTPRNTTVRFKDVTFSRNGESMTNNRPLILGIDLEGMNEDLIHSGLNLKVDRIIEVGAVLWDFNRKRPLQIITELINEADHLPISEEVERLTGIDDEMLTDWGLREDHIKIFLRNLTGYINKADYLMAHNGPNYDIPMLEAMYKRYGMELPKKVWIDTLTDIEYSEKIQNRSMMALEYHHGFINPFPHRAVTDVLAMLKIASNYGLQRMTELAESPKITIVAKLNAPDWKNASEVKKFNKIKNKVSKSKFRWNPSDKTWTREIQKNLAGRRETHSRFRMVYAK